MHWLPLIITALALRSEVVLPPLPTPSVDCAACVESIPPRSAAAPTGSQFLQQTAGLNEAERERAILTELRAGNIPSLLRQLVPLELTGRTGSDQPARATILVMPDYLSIGSDADHVRVPVNRRTAIAVARAYGFVLPTCKVVDAIFEQSPVRLAPLTMPPGPEMRSNAYYRAHNRAIDRQLDGVSLGVLKAGHKKDLVLTRRLAHQTGRVAIYGWHRPDGRPIQPLSTFHGAGYADYSHGLRLVSAQVWIDGAPRSIYDVLEDPELASLLSDEGPIPEVRQILAARSF